MLRHEGIPMFDQVGSRFRFGGFHVGADSSLSPAADGVDMPSIR